MRDMVNNRIVYPNWLEPLLNASYYQECKRHGSRLYHTYCKDCMGEALCEYCVKGSGEHYGHNIVHIKKVSHKPAISLEDINGALNISHIQPYTINSGQVLQLRSKAGEEPKPAPNRCIICNYGLMKSKYKYCSIKCQIEGDMRPHNEEGEEEEVYPVKTKRVHGCSSRSSRKREELYSNKIIKVINSCRKGVPHRAPLF